MKDLQQPPTEADIADIARLPEPVSGVVRRLAFQRDLLAAENAELREQVRRLREALRKADVLLTSFAVARNFSEHQKDAAANVLAEVVAALAATAPKEIP